MTRMQNSIKNIKYAVSGQIVNIMISFVARTIFVRYLSIEFLGLNGLFTNILSVLSLAELGIGSAIIYSMYSPLSQGDINKVSALMTLYKKAYISIGLFIALIGISITPFLHLFIKEVPSIENIRIIYLLFLGNTVTTYFFSYKRALIVADQKKYIDSSYHYVSSIIINLLQIIILIFTREYILFLVIKLVVIVIENILISNKADRLYPYLKSKNKIEIDDEDKKTIIRNIKAMFLHRIGGIVVKSTDNLMISSFIGLSYVGIYSNYLLIIHSLKAVFQLIFQSITPSVGNLGATENKDHIKKIFIYTDFISFWIYGFSSIVLVNLFNPFISLWLGEEYLFSMPIVIFIVINFYIEGRRISVLTFKDALGLFWYDRYKPLIESAVNLIVSIFLIQYIGVAGVLIGTTISSLTTVFWIEPYVLYKYGFKSGIKPYFINYINKTIIILLVGSGTWWLCNLFPENNFKYFIYRMLVSTFVPNILLFIVYRKTDEFKYLFNNIKRYF